MDRVNIARTISVPWAEFTRGNEQRSIDFEYNVYLCDTKLTIHGITDERERRRPKWNIIKIHGVGDGGNGMEECLSVQRWWPRNGKRMRVVQTFSSTVTYGPFTRDYIHLCDLTFSGVSNQSQDLYAPRFEFSAPRENSRSRQRLPSVFVVSRQLLQRGDLRGKLFHPVQRESGYACVCAERRT